MPSVKGMRVMSHQDLLALFVGVLAKTPEWLRQDLASRDRLTRERAEEALAAMIVATASDLGWAPYSRPGEAALSRARRRYQVRGTDKNDDQWIFATDDRERAEAVLGHMPDSLNDIEMIENE